MLGGTGLIGIIIGFGMRDIAENFLASILLSVRNPFHAGDLIEVGGNTGVVQNLNVRSTVLLTLDGHQVQIPNSIVYKSIIKNYSSIPSRRAEFTVGISYDILGCARPRSRSSRAASNSRIPLAKPNALTTRNVPLTRGATGRRARVTCPTRPGRWGGVSPKATCLRRRKTCSRDSAPRRPTRSGSRGRVNP